MVSFKENKLVSTSLPALAAHYENSETTGAFKILRVFKCFAISSHFSHNTARRYWWWRETVWHRLSICHFQVSTRRKTVYRQVTFNVSDVIIWNWPSLDAAPCPSTPKCPIFLASDSDKRRNTRPYYSNGRRVCVKLASRCRNQRSCWFMWTYS